MKFNFQEHNPCAILLSTSFEMKQFSFSVRRTNGGVFLTLLKSGGYATKEQIKEIFAEERAMQVAKDREKNSRRAREARQQQQQQQNISELGTGEEF